ncbi:DMT family transporter [Sneathiella sp. CAU 1612]|jgi:drug/metabolite transporter (DMT)-like permease|uniref:DMT family transporter n=1 Tax=Sneathiella sedimenti TaxID=2816034 RepID=A0ABS3F6U6_9PROT|nr:DMT family transporter [Sneathiella sedimenti]MBO0334248.1 DMT family transporter [Sneathiella sedimenti]
MREKSPHLYGVLITAAGVLLLTPDGLLVRLIGADSATILFWRGILFSIGIFGFYLLRRGVATLGLVQAMGKRGLLAALLFSLSTCFFVLAITHTSAANALVIIATAPLFAALFSWLILKETISLSTWIAIGVCIGGISLIFLGSVGGGSRDGDFYAIICAFMIAGQITTVRHARSVDMVPSLGIAGLLTALIALPFSAPLAITGLDFMYLCILGLIVLPCAFGLITIGPRYISAPEVSLLMLMESILGPFWVWLVLAEVPRPETFIGGAIVIATLVIHTGVAYRKSRPVPARG